MRTYVLSFLPIGLLALAGCNRVPSADASSTTTTPTTSTTTAQTAPVPPLVTLPAGTKFRVRLLQALDTRRNRAGDQFTASLDEPLVNGNEVVVPKGTTFTGHIVQAKPSGRFKGRAEMELTLDTFALNGQVYQIRSSDSARASKGHGRHDAVWIGGGAGGGALVGAAAAGGPGALIGAGAGAAAGTIGSVITGKKQIHLPAEMELRFALQTDVTLSS